MDRARLMERMEREMRRHWKGRRFNLAAAWIAWDGCVKEYGLTEHEQAYLLARYPPPGPRPAEPARGYEPQPASHFDQGWQDISLAKRLPPNLVPAPDGLAWRSIVGPSTCRELRVGHRVGTLLADIKWAGDEWLVTVNRHNPNAAQPCATTKDFAQAHRWVLGWFHRERVRIEGELAVRGDDQIAGRTQ